MALRLSATAPSEMTPVARPEEDVTATSSRQLATPDALRQEPEALQPYTAKVLRFTAPIDPRSQEASPTGEPGHEGHNHGDHSVSTNSAPVEEGNGGMPTQGVLTSKVGWRWGRMHNGIDIGAPTGTPIQAWRSGTVTEAGNAGDGYGYKVVIQHADGSTSLYAHASALHVGVGEEVTQGQLIADVGSTGYSTGPHLHFEIRAADGTVLNPLDYIDNNNPMPVSATARNVENLTAADRAKLIQSGEVFVAQASRGLGHGDGQIVVETRDMIARSLVVLAEEADRRDASEGLTTDIGERLRALSAEINNGSGTVDQQLDQAIRVTQVLLGIVEDPNGPGQLAATTLVHKYQSFDEVISATQSNQAADKATDGLSLAPDGIVGLRTHIANSLLLGEPLFVSGEEFRSVTRGRWSVRVYANEREVELGIGSEEDDESYQHWLEEQRSFRELLTSIQAKASNGETLTAFEAAAVAYNAGFRNPGTLKIMVQILHGESGLRPGVSYQGANGASEDSWGLAQVNLHAHSGRPGVNSQSLQDPVFNLQVAYDIYSDAGHSFQPWGAYTNGSYANFADEAKAGVDQFFQFLDAQQRIIDQQDPTGATEEWVSQAPTPPELRPAA